MIGAERYRSAPILYNSKKDLTGLCEIVLITVQTQRPNKCKDLSGLEVDLGGIQ